MPANVVVPEVGESIVDARVAKWLKKEGDAVSAGEPLVELETDKIDLEVSAPKAGVLSRIAHGDGADVKVGEVLGVIEEDAASAAAATQPGAGNEPEAASRQPEAESREPAAVSGEPEAASRQPAAGSRQPEADNGAKADRKRVTPAAKNVAAKNDVDL